MKNHKNTAQKPKNKRGTHFEFIAITILLLTNIVIYIICIFNVFPQKIKEDAILAEEALNEQKKFNISFAVYDALQIQALSGVSIMISNSQDEIISKGITNEYGVFDAKIPAEGKYTISYEGEGYYGDSVKKDISSENKKEILAMVPITEDDGAYILLTWDGDEDLDLCLFNTITEETVCIKHPVDINNNFLFSDGNKLQPFELLFLQDIKDNIARNVYVLNYSAIQSGEDKLLADTNAYVAIYGKDGKIAGYNIEENTTDSLWRPCQITNNKFHKDGTTFSELPDWVTANKLEE